MQACALMQAATATQVPLDVSPSTARPTTLPQSCNFNVEVAQQVGPSREWRRHSGAQHTQAADLLQARMGGSPGHRRARRFNLGGRLSAVHRLTLMSASPIHRALCTWTRSIRLPSARRAWL